MLPGPLKEGKYITLTSIVKHERALQDGYCCSGAVLETCTKNLQELRRAFQKGLLHQHKVSPNNQRFHGARRRPYRNRWVKHMHSHPYSGMATSLLVLLNWFGPAIVSSMKNYKLVLGSLVEVLIYYSEM